MPKDITPFDGGLIDPRQVEAMNIIMTKEVPESAKQKRPGKGGQSWTYLSHVWVTQTLQEGLQNQWSFEVLDWEVYNETIRIKKKDQYIDVPTCSIAARCRFTLHVIINPEKRKFPSDPLIFDRVVTEVGVFEKNPAMPTAMGVASAVSRGLCRCVMRALGIGLELYAGDDPEPTATQAWTSLKRFGINQGARWNEEFETEYVKALKEKGITSENIVDRYSDAYNLLAEMLGKVVKLEDMPDIE